MRARRGFPHVAYLEELPETPFVLLCATLLVAIRRLKPSPPSIGYILATRALDPAPVAGGKATPEHPNIGGEAFDWRPAHRLAILAFHGGSCVSPGPSYSRAPETRTGIGKGSRGWGGKSDAVESGRAKY